MAKGYQFRTLENFPDWHNPNRIISTGIQDAFDGLAEYRPANTRLRFVGDSEHSEYYKYEVRHEVERHMYVRFETRDLDRVIQITKFDMFVAKDGSHAWVVTNKVDCNEMFRRIQERVPDLYCGEEIVNLAQLSEDQSFNIGGAHFREVRLADLTAASIYGSTVTQSEDWERYIKNSRISYLLLEYPKGGNVYKTNVTQNKGVVVLQRLSESATLDLLVSISELLHRYTITIDDDNSNSD